MIKRLIVAFFLVFSVLPSNAEANHEGNCYWIPQLNYNPDRIYAECTNAYSNPDEIVSGWFRLHFWKYHWEPWGKVYVHCATGWAHKSKSEAFEVIYGFATSDNPHIETQYAGLNPYIVYYHGSQPSGRARCW